MATNQAVNNRAKGKRIVQFAKQALELQGALVCVAPLQAKWIGPGRAINVAGDYFGVFDMLAVWPDGRRALIQVTTAEHANDRRRKILASAFPCSSEDLILGYVEGRGRHFRVWHGPAFRTEETDEWTLAQEPDAITEHQTG